MSRKRAPKVALIGRTNVGKSTLFNALCRERERIVEDFAGVTRDRAQSLVTLGDYIFELIDTGGLLGESEDPLAAAVTIQSEIAVNEAQIIIAVLDGLGGVHPDDEKLARIIRESGKPVIWVVNKCEKPSSKESAVEFHRLGIDQYICISAAHRENLHELLSSLREKFAEIGALVPDEDATQDEDGPLRVALIGRPNVGKSSIVNRIVGSERVITSPVAGTTRDSIDIDITREGKDYTLVDTAGLRKKSQVPEESLERYANLRSLQALARCDVAVLVLDATSKPLVSDQERRIANLIHNRGLPLVIVLNKWDLVEKDNTSVKKYKELVFDRLNFCTYAPLVFVSAVTGRRCNRILEEASSVFSSADVRVKTSELNKVLEQAFQRTPPPIYRGHPVKLYFATQINSLPPTIILFVNQPKMITESYERYLKKKLRERFTFAGTDIKLQLRKRRSAVEDEAQYYEEESP